MSSLVAHSIDYTAREKIVEQHAAPGSGKTVMRDCKDIPPGGVRTAMTLQSTI